MNCIDSSDLRVDFSMEADRDVAGRDFRRMYFYNGEDRTYSVEGQVTLQKQDKEYCLPPYTVYISVSTQLL